MPDAERWFKLGWETAPGRDGSVRLRGYLVNTYGEPAGQVRVLAQVLDANGNVLAQRIEWVHFFLSAGDSGYTCELWWTFTVCWSLTTIRTWPRC